MISSPVHSVGVRYSLRRLSRSSISILSTCRQSFRAALSMQNQLFHQVLLSIGISYFAQPRNFFMRSFKLWIYTTKRCSFPKGAQSILVTSKSLILFLKLLVSATEVIASSTACLLLQNKKACTIRLITWPWHQIRRWLAFQSVLPLEIKCSLSF